MYDFLPGDKIKASRRVDAMRSMKRTWPSSELPPLSVDDVPGHKPQRLPQLSTGADAIHSQPTVYPRLQTLTQLTSRYVHGLHTGNFIARSEMRWQNFDGVDSPNSARDRSINTVKRSAALVIQCSWRRHAATRVRECLKAQVWQQQLTVAARITQHSSNLTRAVMADSDQNRLQMLASITSMVGFYYQAPARLLSWWLAFTCAQLIARRILRHPPVAVRTVDVLVKLTRRKLVALWRFVVPLAVLVLQCSVRVFIARREVGKRRLERLRLKAALRLQGFFRVYNAQHIARRIRRWSATVRIQCLWRCYHARECLQQRRITWVATCFCTPLLLQAAKQATAKLRVRSARTIQKYYRGCRARAKFRGLLSRHEQRKWQQNPSKGFDFFELERYDRAALYLENCFRQGIFADEALPSLPSSEHILTDQILVRNSPHRKLASGSRMSFSFSAAPTKLGTDWILQRDHSPAGIDSSNEVARLAGRLQFWQAYAICHFRTFEATGDVLNLNQALVGWKSYLEVDTVVKSWAPFQVIAASLKELHIRSQYQLSRCLFWRGKQRDKEKALKLSLSLQQEITRSTFIAPGDTLELEAQLLMMSSMLYYDQGLLAESCRQLDKVRNLPPTTAFTDLEIHLTLALVLMKRYEECSTESARAAKSDDFETSTLMYLRTATQLLKQCYCEIELWPSVGFYHGWLKKSDAKRLLSKEKVGSYLLYSLLDAAGTGDKVHKHRTSPPADNILLQVKLSDRPLRIVSLRIEFTSAGLYKIPKMADHLGHFSLHGLVANLPPEAGVQMDLGIRKSLYTPSLQKKLEKSESELLQDKLSLRSRLLHWDEWERKINEMATIQLSDTGRQWKRRNETWGSVCFEVAKALECSEAWVFAELAAHEALLHTKDRSLRANVSFLAARVAINLQKRNEGALLMQQAHLEMDRKNSSPKTKLFIENLTAVQRALTLNVSISRQESFSSRLERVQKLERLCLKAWRCDSLAERFRGDPFREALLLQRIADEMYAECGDTVFIRSLLKAHVRAYVGNAVWYEGLHLKCAYACVAQLFDRFHKHQAFWTTHLENLTRHIREKTQTKKTMTKTRAFDVKLLLLSWHHMPFLLCFEMAEVLYRYKSNSVSPLIDVYESLLGRLRGSQPRTPVYAAYEELILLRLSFLHASKVSHKVNSWRHLDAAVSAIDEIIEQRADNARLFTSEILKSRAKKLKWPCSIRLPFHFSDGEVIFMRGFFVQLQEDMMGIPAERRSSWRDYHPLHHKLMELVMKAAPPGEMSIGGGRMLNSVQYRAENLRGLRIFVGATHDVAISNIMLSQPFVLIRHEGTTTPTRTPPTWTNLSPSWEEDIEIPVSSPKANIIISVMNRTRRNSRWQDATTIGFVSVAMYDLLAAHEGITEGKYYELTDVKQTIDRPRSGNESRRGNTARIFLTFQVIVKSQPMLPPSAKRTALWATRSGNWDVEDVRANLHGDLQVFASSRWIWSRFASVFMQDNDLFIAKWFYVKSVRLTPELQRRTSKVGLQLNTADSLAIVNDLVGLSRCYRANLSDVTWGRQAAPLLEQAEAILTRKLSQTKREYRSLSDRAALEMLLVAVRELQTDVTTRKIGPLEEALSRKPPATSEWIKVTNRRPSGGISTRYFNQDTGEIFQSSWQIEPLEYEDIQAVMVEEQERLPHRIVIMASDMKARVKFHRQELIRLHAEDPYQWVAVFNDRKKETQFFSPHFPGAYCSSKANKYPTRPPTYVMLADEFLLYHVLLVQDAYRKYRWRRQRQRRLRGVFLSACLVSRELPAIQRRNLLRSLNCVRVVVEKARHLRAADLIASDPFVTLALTGPSGEVMATGKTNVRYNTLNPKWNEEFHFRYSFTQYEALRLATALSLNEGGDTIHVCEAFLTLKVFDYDVVSTHEGDNREHELVDDKEGGNLLKKEAGPDEFLGMVTIPIQTFLHGKRMTADLALVDEKGENNSPRARGSLTISVHWTHCDNDGEKEAKVAKLWAIGSGGGRALIAKKAKDRPELPEEVSREIDLLRQLMEQLVQKMMIMATDALEPMHRLDNRLQIAQATGKTADEAKMLEQRLNGLLHTQLLPILTAVRDLVVERIDNQFPVVLKKLFGPIEEYLSSFDQSTRRELRSSMEKCLDQLNATMDSMKVVPVKDISAKDAMILAFDQQHHVNVWNGQLRQILETFFIGEKAQWQFSLDEQVDEVYSKLSAGGVRQRGEGKPVGRPATAAAVAKRKDRIERVKQEKAWYEL